MAWLDWVALWHRRFLIGLLPLLCLGAGLLWETCWENCCGRLAMKWVRGIGGGLLGCAVALGLMVSEGTIWVGRMRVVPEVRWVRRGEAWREAVAYLRAHRQVGERVALAAQLLESEWLVSGEKRGGEQGGTRALSTAQLEYLTYPVRGPYELEDVMPWGPLDDWAESAVFSWLQGRAVADAELAGAQVGGEQVWLLIRGRETRVWEWLEGFECSLGVELIPFGKLTVVRIWEEAR